jgi:hypothetical protein
LWYIDGHHASLASRSCPVPPFFSRFVGYNKPELSKHRKRSISNLSRDKIDEFTSLLQDYCTSSWMKQDQWALLKDSLFILIESLASYSAYLTMKNESMKIHHALPEPATVFEDAISIKYIESTSSSILSSLLTDIDRAVQNTDFYQVVPLSEHCPKEKRKRYLFIHELEKGLSVSIFLLTYLHDSNVGNYYFIWKVPTPLHHEACSIENTRIVSEIKKQSRFFTLVQ